MRRPVLAFVAGAVLLGTAGPASSQEAGSSELTPFQVTRVERFLENRASCQGCHRIGGSGGLIGPSLDGVGERVDRDYVLSMIRDPGATVPGTMMPRQPMPDREAGRLATYLMSLPPTAPDTAPVGAPRAPPPLDPANRLNGESLYARYCASCHGSEGRGDGWNAPNLPVAPTAHADSELMTKRPDDSLYDAIFAGGFVLDRSPRMPGFGSLLDPEQIRALVARIRTLCDCEQPVWARGGR
jgi:mono/diheme cytochrome c family protein